MLNKVMKQLTPATPHLGGFTGLLGPGPGPRWTGPQMAWAPGGCWDLFWSQVETQTARNLMRLLYLPPDVGEHSSALTSLPGPGDADYYGLSPADTTYRTMF